MKINTPEQYEELQQILQKYEVEYSVKIKHNGKPKHSFSHFIRVISMVDHHRRYIRTKIEWWSSNVL